MEQEKQHILDRAMILRDEKNMEPIPISFEDSRPNIVHLSGIIFYHKVTLKCEKALGK
mgnify:CR=1 FL=1